MFKARFAWISIRSSSYSSITAAKELYAANPLAVAIRFEEVFEHDVDDVEIFSDEFNIQ